MFKLIDGCLPARTDCPVPDCPCTKAGKHRGKAHESDFSCGLLRSWLMTKEGKSFLEQHGEKCETNPEGTPSNED